MVLEYNPRLFPAAEPERDVLPIDDKPPVSFPK